MDWIHCNSCFVQPGEMKGKRYNLTNCGHIYCDNCLKPDSSEQCKVCKSKFTTVPLTNEMRPDVQEFFTGLDEMLNKMLKVLTFQNGHRLRFIAYNRTMAAKYKNAKEEIRRLNEIIIVFQKKMKELEKEVRTLKKKLSLPPPSNSGKVHSSSTFLTSTPKAPSSSPVNLPSPLQSMFPKVSPQFSQSCGSWISPNRLTLDSSPVSGTSSPASRATASPDINERTFMYRRLPATPSHRKTYTTPSYRTVSQYSSESNTTNTPSTPRTPDLPDPNFPALPTSASRNVGQPRVTTPISPFTLLSLNSQRSTRII